MDVPWGLTLHYEPQNLVSIVGKSPAATLDAATQDATKWHRVPDRGSIETQKRADVVTLNSNRLENITNTRDIHGIWVLGVGVENVAKITNETITNLANNKYNVSSGRA